MKRIVPVLLATLMPVAALADGAIDGWVRVHGHQYALHPVTVRVFDAQTGDLIPEFTTENRPDGTYDIPNVPAGDYKVHYDAHGDIWRYLDELAGNRPCDNAGCDVLEEGAVITVSDGETITLNTNLMEGVMMTGTVTDFRHRPLAGATVEFFDSDGNPHCCARVTDEQGEWARPLYFPASYYVRARYTTPSEYLPKVYPNRDCAGCDVATTGSRVTFDYYTAFIGMKLRLNIVEPDPQIDIVPVARQKYSGSWFNPDREGEGFIVEVLDKPGPEGVGSEVVVFWFTYDPDGGQSWMVGTGVLIGRTAEVDFEITDGAAFGAGFDPAAVERERWGALRLEFLNCNRAHAQYAGEWGSGQIDLNRLSNIDELGCNAPDDEMVTGNAVYSGAWFNPEREGEGFIMEFVDEDQVLTYWFTYDTDGSQMWMLGVGEVDESLNAEIPLLRSSGGRFGAEFDPENVFLDEWGTVDFRFDACDGASYSWAAAPPYDSGAFALSRLTELKNTVCENE